MRINDSNIWKNPTLDSQVGNGGRLQLRQPRGNDITLPWQPPGGQAVVKSVQQPTQSDQPSGSFTSGGNSMRETDAAFGVTPNGTEQTPGNGNGSAAGTTPANPSAGTPVTLPAQGPGNAGDNQWPWVKPGTDGNLTPSYPNDGQAPAYGGAQGGGTLDPGFGVNPGNSSGTPATGGATRGDIDPGFTPGSRTDDSGGTTGAVGDASSPGSGKSIYEWYKEYLEKLGNYKTPSATSQEEMIRKMYEASLAANKSQLESDYNQNLSDLDAEASTIGSTYYEQQRQAQAQSDRNRQAFQEYANARGLNSGTGGQAELAQQNQLSANMNNLRQSEAEKRAEIERQRVLLGQQYQSAIQKAQADNDLNLAKALYEEAVRVDESLTSAAKADADRALQMFNILNSSVKDSIGSDSSAYSELISASGGDTDQINKLYNMAKQIKTTKGYYTSRGSSGGSSSSSGTYRQAKQDEIEWAEYYIDIINRAGGIDNVEDYLATNYKNYGIPYQKVSKTTSSMAETAKKYSTNKYVIGSEKGRDIAGKLSTGNRYYAPDGSVWRKSSNGKIYVTKDGVEMEADIKG